jgi:uncharacterized NAD(P)/FAD-binding protein YdhS
MALVGIVGGGFSGAITAYRLIGTLPAGSEIVIHEPNKDLGRGVAYAEGPEHFLLNVPARQQSPCLEDPEGFLRWILERRGDALRFQQGDGAYYLPRSWFGTYMRELVAEKAASRRDVSLHHLRTPIVALRSDGAKPIGVTRDDARTFDAIVLAIGNAPPRPLPVHAETGSAPQVIQSAWGLNRAPLPSSDARIVIVGTGLTMVDAVADLAARGRKGPLVSVSRHGLFHQRTGGHNPEFIPPEEPLERTTLALMRQIRRWCELSHEEHNDWRPALDYARINAPKLWRGLSPAEQKRFVRHARPYWNIHRYQAPSHGYLLIQKLLAMKQLVLVKGTATEISSGGLVVTRDETRRTVPCDLVINAMGPDLSHRTNYAQLADLVAPLGLDVDLAIEEGVDIDDSGEVQNVHTPLQGRVWALGSLARRRFGELGNVSSITSVADKLGGALSHRLCSLNRSP